MMLEKTLDNEVIEEQMVNSVESPTIWNKDVESLAHNIDQPVDRKEIISVIKDRFTKLEDASIALQTQQFSSKNENVLDNVLSSERDFILDISWLRNWTSYSERM